MKAIGDIDNQISKVERLYEKVLLEINKETTKELFLEIEKTCQNINRDFGSVKSKLQIISNETKTISGDDSRTRKNQQVTVIAKLQKSLKSFDKLQRRANEQYKDRIKREYKIVRPFATDEEVKKALESCKGGEAFSQAMMNSSLNTAYESVKGRRDEMLKIEKSIEEIAKLFTDLQLLLQVNIILI